MKILLLLSLSVFAFACGKVTGKDEVSKESNTSGVQNPNSPEGAAPGAPPAYISHNRINPTLLEVSLTKELTDATATNTSNFIFNNGLQAVSVAKKPGEPTTLQITTTTQQQINYTLTMVGLTTVESVNLAGVIQITFEGLPSPAITSVTWRDPAATSNPLPGSAYGIGLCVLQSGSGSVCTTAPFYNRTALYGKLNGGSAVAYRYKIDAGPWSAEIPIATPFSVTGLADGYHTIYFIGKHANGYWQSETANDVFSLSYVQDSTAPEAYIDPLTYPASVTASTSFNVRVIGTDVSYFLYCLDNSAITDCSSSNWQGITGAPLASLGYGLPIGTYPGTLQPGSVRIRVRGIDASGNVQASFITGGEYTWVVDTGTVEAIFNASDIAALTTTGTTASVRVTNAGGAVAYKGKIVSGTDCNTGTPWNALPEITNLATPITATGLSANGGYYTVCAIGKSLGSNWQGGWNGSDPTVSVVTKYSWIVDTTAPTAAVTWLTPPYAYPGSSPAITVTHYEWQVSTSDGVTHYRYAVVSGAGNPCSSATYSAETPVATPIVFDAALTGVNTYKLCVIARDAAGNYQPVTSASTEGEWTVDKEPPANNPAFATLSQSARSFNIPVIQFDIDNSTAPTDAYYYKIEVAKDTAFTPPLVSSITVESCKSETSVNCPTTLTTRNVTVTVDPFTQGSVYARIQAGDKQGNYRSDYSATSAEHYVVGKITGVVKNTAGNPLSGISVRMQDANGNSLSALYPNQTTDAAGAFTFDNVRTAKKAYRVVAAQGDATYRPAMKQQISVQEKGSGGTIVTNIGSMTLVAQSVTTAQNIVGKIVDAEDGWMLGYAEVKLIDWQGNTVSTVRTVYTNNAYTDCDTVAPAGDPPTNIPKMISNGGGVCGDFIFSNVTPGTYSLEVNGLSWNPTLQTYNNLLKENLAVAGSAEMPFMVVRGGVTGTYNYVPQTHAFRNGPSLGITPSSSGAHAFRIPTGAYANKYMLIDGASTNTRIYSPIDNSVFPGPGLPAAAAAGAFTIPITTGPESGKFLIFRGNGSTTTWLYNPADNTVTTSITTPAALADGAHAIAITTGTRSGQYLIVRGNGSTAVYFYKPLDHAFETPSFSLPANAGAGAFSFTITGGMHAGKTLIVLGGGTMNTALYDPSTDSMAAGPGLTGNAGQGAHAFQIPSGSEAGNWIVIHGNNSNTTSLYNSASGLFASSPGLPANAGAGASSYLLEAGPQAGKIMTIAGNNTTATFLFNPAASPFSSAFTSSVAVPAAVTNGGFSFRIQEMSAGRMPIVRTLVGQDLKILLSWGNQNPRDLDLHIVGTLPPGQTHTNPDDNCDNTKFHVNWRRSAGNWQQQYSAKTRTFIQPDPAYQGQQFFPLHPDTTTALVQDTTTGFGPEMINLIGGYTNGTYWVTVVNWSQWNPNAGAGDTKANQQWDVTDVQLRVYDANGLAFEMTASQPSVTPTALAPAGLVAGCGAGGAADWQQCELWQAFSLTVSGSGSAGRIYTPINTYVNWQDATGTYDYSKCNLSGF
jgi:hypothetical protein